MKRKNLLSTFKHVYLYTLKILNLETSFSCACQYYEITPKVCSTLGHDDLGKVVVWPEAGG